MELRLSRQAVSNITIPVVVRTELTERETFVSESGIKVTEAGENCSRSHIRSIDYVTFSRVG